MSGEMFGAAFDLRPWKIFSAIRLINKSPLLGPSKIHTFTLGAVHKLRRQKRPTDHSSNHDFCDID